MRKLDKSLILAMSAKDIERLLREWALNGLITSKTLMGRDYKEITKKYAKKELYVTSVEGIDATSEEVQETFELLHDTKRIMTMREYMAISGHQTSYAVNREVKRGNVLRFDILGKRSILYIL